jgi:glycosyltransferase involved in cell wall biosynthesis
MIGLARKLLLGFRQHLLEAKARRKAHHDEKARRNSPDYRAMRRESLHRLTAAPRKRAVAMVGVAPPTRSGIATFNQAILAGLPAEIDFFGDFSTIDDVERMADAVAAAPSLVRVFSESAFLDALQLNSYRAAIFILGNSDQNVFALRASRLAEAAGVKNILFYAHDPFLFNLYLGSIGADRQRFRQEMIAAYGGQPLQERAIDGLSWPPDLREFFRNKWLTLRPLLRGRKVAGLIVNSVAARELIEAEVQDLPPRDAIHVLFHPILPLTRTASAASGGKNRFRIGTFGIPDPVKRTERILAAWRRIKTTMPDAELILAGYFASAYAAENSLDAGESGLNIVDSPSEAELLNLMASIDVAVQLRSENRGESSGIVHQLLGLHRRVIVSAHGSYRDLGDAVIQIPPDASEATIAEAILNSSLDETLSERAAAYADAHSLQRYHQEFCALIEKLRD